MRATLLALTLLVALGGTAVRAQTTDARPLAEATGGQADELPAALQRSASETQVRLAELQTTMSEFQSEFRRSVSDVRHEMRMLMSEARSDGVQNARIAGIAAGALTGGLVIDLLGGSGLATLTGAVLGATLAHLLMLPPEDAAAQPR
jgi:uncharacterized protein YcfJ